jgi:cytochrome c peroxidase
MNTGIADAARRTPDMPLYTLRNKATGERLQTTDPGAAMTTGKWIDIGKFKTPSLRGLETHSPYMHNGFSGDLLDIINFYDTRFSIGLTEKEKSDLKVFLQSL